MRIDLKTILLLLLLFVAPAIAQEAAEAAPPPDETKSALDIYKDGGWFMHVLLVCSMGTIAVIVYCFIQITPKKMAPKNHVDQINAAIADTKTGSARRNVIIFNR